MIEATGPTWDKPDARNVADLLRRRARSAPEHVAFTLRRGQRWEPITTAEFERQVTELAAGLIAAGITVGDRLAIVAPTRFEWAVMDLAGYYAGAVIVPIHPSATPEQLGAILADAEVSFAVCSEEAGANILRAAAKARGRKLGGIWTMEPSGADLETLRELGKNVAENEVERRSSLAEWDTLATIVYTSGTTEQPKGVLLTHGDLVGKVETVALSFREVVNDSGSTVIFLPLAHVLARALQLCCIAAGMRVAHIDRPRDVLATLKELEPTFLVVVPQILQRILTAVQDNARAKHLLPLWRCARATAVAWGKHLVDKQDDSARRPGWWLAAKHFLYDRLFYGRIRALLGGKIAYLLSGAARLEAEVAHFFLGIEVPVIEGYGLSESTAPLTANLLGDLRPGSVGTPLPGVTVRISADGEVWAKGVGVTNGYRNPELNAEAFHDGFFRTGDLGQLDDRGRLRLTGRTKDVIVTAGGKTISPTAWESRAALHPLVSHAVLVGDDRPFLIGLLILDLERVDKWYARHRLTKPEISSSDITLVEQSELLDALWPVAKRANRVQAGAERARRFAVAAGQLSVENGLLTPTLKLRRAEFLRRNAATITKLYSPDATAYTREL